MPPEERMGYLGHGTQGWILPVTHIYWFIRPSLHHHHGVPCLDNAIEEPPVLTGGVDSFISPKMILFLKTVGNANTLSPSTGESLNKLWKSRNADYCKNIKDQSWRRLGLHFWICNTGARETHGPENVPI